MKKRWYCICFHLFYVYLLKPSLILLKHILSFVTTVYVIKSDLMMSFFFIMSPTGTSLPLILHLQGMIMNWFCSPLICSSLRERCLLNNPGIKINSIHMGGDRREGHTVYILIKYIHCGGTGEEWGKD